MDAKSSPSLLWPLGVFRAISATDCRARVWGGQPYYLINALGREPADGELVEICFEDGTWMLAAAPDLDEVDSRQLAQTAGPATSVASSADALGQVDHLLFGEVGRHLELERPAVGQRSLQHPSVSRDEDEVTLATVDRY